MDLIKELSSLDKNKVFIHSGWDHYANGSNLCFSIQFLDDKCLHSDGHRSQTGWYNDNHEFGDAGQTMEAAVKLANWYLEDSERILSIDSSVVEFREIKELKCEFMKSIIVNPIIFENNSDESTKQDK